MRKIILIVANMLVLGTAIGAVAWGMHKQDAQATADCTSSGPVRRLTVKDNKLSPAKLTVKRCAILQVTNKDTAPTSAYRLYFGKHDHHLAYPGYEPDELDANDSQSILLVKAGTYEFHDHLHDQAVMIIAIQP